MDYRLTATLLDSLGLAMCVFDADDRSVLWNTSFLRFFPEHDGHLHAGEHYGDNLRRFYRGRLSPEDMVHIDRYIADGIQRNRNQTRPYVFQHRGRWLRVSSLAQPDGHRVRVWLNLSTAEAWQHDERPPDVLMRDLQSPDAMQMLEDVGDGAVLLDAQERILYANDRFITMYGFATKAAVAGRTFADLVLDLWDESGVPRAQARSNQDLSAALFDGSVFAGAPFEVPLPGQRWMRVTMNRTMGGQTYAFHSDISPSKRQELRLLQAERHAREREQELRMLTDQLRDETHHDALTGLHNRRALQAQLRDLASNPGTHGLLFIDLDGFKSVNDMAGHAAGDEVLRQVAGLLRGSVRTGDTVVRLGGDEFVVMLGHCDAAQAHAVGTKVVQAVGTQEFNAHGQGFRIGASVGVRIFSGTQDMEGLLRDADIACYAAKRNGRARVEIHHRPADAAS
ncbi:diguanylate cyclase domain-containing protein [Acidovorax sp.]|jgi:diguanylate cyclase (GGDEF)-like protein|uniref:sensor domain-containing diguanylate cyclase n=1 Tax=Acidovorax sp. TaxID=1872122 RepID=UPI00391EF414